MLLTNLIVLASFNIAFGIKTTKELTETLPEIGLKLNELIEYYGYTDEDHTVETEDGYRLTLNHILPSNKNATGNKRAVLLNPGLTCSAAVFVLNREGSLAFYLADAGYDVWLLNYRGTTYSRQHITLDPDEDKEKFFSYSWHEIGFYDIPASIDYILEKTGQSSLYYVGHSQGTTSLFVMGSSRPEYNAKIRVAVALAPVAYVEHLSQPILRLAAENIAPLKLLLSGLEFYEIAPHWDIFTDIGVELCSDGSEMQPLCEELLYAIGGKDAEQLNSTLLPLYLSHVPAGLSKKQLIHYQQGITEGTFSQYSYGVLGNLLHYGEAEPPKYDLSKMTCPVALVYAQKDLFASLDDVGRLIRELPNVVATHLVDYENFTHLDFMIAKEANKYVNEPVLNILSNY